MPVISNSEDLDLLTKKIKSLLLLKQEGEYWDFKEKWYSKDKKTSLLHDVICMANNLSPNDGLIIFGVKDEDKTICGVENDDNRRTTQNIVDFLRDKQFHGDCRPQVQVVTINIDGHDLDVLIVFWSTNVPFTLRRAEAGLRPNNIYTRVADTNTPIDKSADRDLQEKLWRRHFGIDLSPLQRMNQYLDDTENWYRIDERNTTVRYYYRDFPEFIFEYELDDERDGFEVFLANQCDSTPWWGWFNLYYYQTKLETYQVAVLDGGRAAVPTPDTCFTDIRNSLSRSFNLPFRYRYYVINTQRWKILQNVWKNKNRHSEESIAISRLFDLVLIFHSSTEQNEFNHYLKENFHINDLERIEEAYFESHVDNPDPYQIEYKFSLYCVRLLQQFRELNETLIPDLGFETEPLTEERWD